LLIIDSDGSTRELLREALEQDGFDVSIATNPMAALERPYDVVVVDIRTDIGPLLLACPEDLQIVVLTGSDRLEEAMAAVRCGAFDLVLRPFYVEDVSLTVACALARGRSSDLESALFYVERNHALLS
jgi:two-component system, NtrC family, sensor kinase